MSGGNKRLVMNLRERAISADTNRAQSFAAQSRADLLRFLHNLPVASTDRPWERGQPLLIGDLPTAVDTPLRGDVIDGLVVVPIVGTSSLHISPGIVGLMDPDGQAGSSDPDPPSTNDSVYKLVTSTGIQSNGVLTVAANAGPGARLDTVECQRNPNVNIETDSRDVFDLSLGAFGSQTVDKVDEGQLTFRVRAGAAGAGLPAPVQGWLPLAVVTVPSAGGADTDDMDLWDVRPLVADRIVQPFRTSYSYGPAHDMQQLYGDIVTAGGENRVSGHFWGQINGVRAGGEISRGSPGVDQAYIDVLDAEWQEPGFTVPSSGSIVYLWLLFPFGLPRWVRYNRTPISGLRFPDGMRGIPVLSATPPQSQSHQGSSLAPITLPTYLSPGADTADAVCVAAFTASGLDTPTTFVAGGEWVEFIDVVAPAPITPPLNGTGNPFDNYRLVIGDDFPRDARKVRVKFEATFSGVAGTNLTYNIQAGPDHLAAGRVADSLRDGGSNQFDAALSITLTRTVEIERIPEQSGIGADLFVNIDWNAGGFGVKSAETAQVIGWKQTG